MSWLSGNALELRPRTVVALLLVMLGLQLAAGIGLAWVAGFDAVRGALGHVSWPWLGVLVGALGASLLGYHQAYRGTLFDHPGWSLPRKQTWPVVLAGFGGFVAHGATQVDVAAARAAGADSRQAAVRASALGGLEYGVLALGGCGAAIAVLVLGFPEPTPDFTMPWAVIPVPGFLVGFWIAHRYAERLAGRAGWRDRLAVFLDSITVVRRLFARPIRRPAAVMGMALFWAGDGLAAWAGLAMFGATMRIAPFVVGFATGLVFTRRTGPLAGAGIVAVVLPLTLWYSGAPLAVAVPGIFVYHLLTLWLPLPASLVTWPTLRQMVRANASQPPERISA
ncbi:MAG TPA: hypothetical protein VGK78_08235 [Nocardioides sp.]|uniref:hypothetical protein n=1 Tax=Nocardioides sp. TaxID=35761 RepID=UPI002F413F76